MRVIAGMEYTVKEAGKLRKRHVPLLQLYIFGAPHRRQDTTTISRYRECLRQAFLGADILPPIREPIDLGGYFINPTSTDMDNLICALFRALDKYAPRGHNIGLMKDDSLIQRVNMAPIVINQKGEGARMRAA